MSQRKYQQFRVLTNNNGVVIPHAIAGCFRVTYIDQDGKSVTVDTDCGAGVLRGGKFVVSEPDEDGKMTFTHMPRLQNITSLSDGKEVERHDILI